MVCFNCLTNSFFEVKTAHTVAVSVTLGLVKFGTTREYDTNIIRFLWVCVEYNYIWVIFMLIQLICFINGSYSC